MLLTSFGGSRDEPVRIATTCPRMINIFHNEEFIFRNPPWTMIPTQAEPLEIHQQYVEILARNGVKPPCGS